MLTTRSRKLSIVGFVLLLQLVFSMNAHHPSTAWGAVKEPDWDTLDKVTLKMIDSDKIIFTEDIKRHPDLELQHGFKASEAIEELIGFYWNDPAVVEIIALNDFPLKDSRFKAWSGKIDPKLKGLEAQKNTDRIREVAASKERAANFELIDISIVTLRVNGKLLKPDVHPYIYQGRVMVPFRTLYEAFNGQVDYDFSNKQRVWMKIDQGNGNSTELSMTVGSPTAIKTVHLNGETLVTEITMDVSPQITNNRTFIPARYAAELLNLSIKWCSDIREVVITGALPSITPTIN